MDNIQDNEPIRTELSSKKSSMADVVDSQVEGEMLPPQPESN